MPVCWSTMRKPIFLKVLGNSIKLQDAPNILYRTNPDNNVVPFPILWIHLWKWNLINTWMSFTLPSRTSNFSPKIHKTEAKMEDQTFKSKSHGMLRSISVTLNTCINSFICNDLCLLKLIVRIVNDKWESLYLHCDRKTNAKQNNNI